MGPRGLGPHLAVIRRGHVPLANPVAVIGVGVVCVSNPLLERQVCEAQGRWAGARPEPTSHQPGILMAREKAAEALRKEGGLFWGWAALRLGGTHSSKGQSGKGLGGHSSSTRPPWEGPSLVYLLIEAAVDGAPADLHEALGGDEHLVDPLP